MSNRVVYFNGRFIPESGARISIYDSALIMGDMAFEVTRTYNRQPFRLRSHLERLFASLAATITLAAGLWISALYVKYRDVGHILPMLIQLWMFVSPILYPVSKVPESWRALYALNPVVSVVEGFRWALIPGFQVDFMMFLPSLGVVFVVFVGGLIYFRSMERTFADVI